MHGEPVGNATCPSLDMTIRCSDNGVIRVESAWLFSDPDGVRLELIAEDLGSLYGTPLH